MNINNINTDIAIIGAGGAGLAASYLSSLHGFETIVISKVLPMHSHTVAAQGGINASFGNVTPDDWRYHMYDTIKGADYLADHNAAEFMCKNSVSAVTFLKELGVPFSLDEKGNIYQRKYGGQTTNYGKGELAFRACAARDHTGHSIMNSLYSKASAQDTKFLSESFVTDLIIQDSIVQGLIAINFNVGEIFVINASKVIIATGGYGQVYKTSTSSSICTGDGNGLALEIGIGLQDMEFVQFHPTSLYGTGFLISEATRAEGGYLINGKNERFMSNYAPKYMELASRDVISRAISKEIVIGNGAGKNHDHVLLDIRHLGQKTIEEKLPTIDNICKTFGKIDPAYEPIPILPAAHYTMGGIPTNIHGQVIINKNGADYFVENLYAIGETACVSVHGANRLGCNSLLDLIVFAKSSIDHIKANQIINKNQISNSAITASTAKIQQALIDKGDILPSEIRIRIQEIMDFHAGVYRNKELLSDGLEKLLALKTDLNYVKLSSDSLIYNKALQEKLELSNLYKQALCTIYAALKRTESRGAHYREDYLERDDKNWLKHSLVNLQNYEFTYATREVDFKGLSADSPKFFPESRSY